MNNLLQRTLSGAIFVALVAGSILWCPYAFGGVFVLAAALAVREFHRLSNRQDQKVNVPPAVGMAGAALLFACSYLYASGTLPGIIYAAYGVYVAAVMVAELFRKQVHPIHNWAYFLLGQVMVALPFALLNFILFVPGYRPLILLAVFVTIWVNDTGAYLTGPDMGAQLSACLIYAYANLSLHQIQHARFALDEVQMFLTEGAEQTPQRKAAAAFVAATSAVLLHLPLPESLPSTQEFLPLLPTGLRAFALYVQAHYLYLHQNYTQSIGIVESTLAMGAEQYPITAIYLHLMAVMDHMSLKATQQAQEHLLSAWALARPDDLIEGFGEHHGLLGGMLEAVIKPRWPEDFRRILDITGQFSWGWRQIHNPDTGHQVADNLTSTEFAVAMLVVRGWTTDEIAAHMKVSASTIKKHQAQIKRKLKIDTWEELEPYMLA